MRGTYLKILGAAASGALLIAVLAGPGFATQPASSPSPGPAPMPADKVAAVGKNVDDIAPNADHVVLSEQMRVSSPADLVLNVSAECSILTQLVTGDGPNAQTDSAETSGSVNIYVTVDGKPVPVAGDANGNGDKGDVVFCNRDYARQVTDNETDKDGQDQIADYNRTRTANAFQWLATNTGTAYDDSVIKNGNNILQIDVHAVYDDTDTTASGPDDSCQADFSATCSDAFVGKRTLIVEPTHASVIENTANGAGGQ